MVKPTIVGERGGREVGSLPNGALSSGRKPRRKEVVAAKVKELMPATVRTLEDTRPEGVTPVGNGYFLLAQMQKFQKAKRKIAARPVLREASR